MEQVQVDRRSWRRLRPDAVFGPAPGGPMAAQPRGGPRCHGAVRVIPPAARRGRVAPEAPPGAGWLSGGRGAALAVPERLGPVQHNQVAICIPHVRHVRHAWRIRCRPLHQSSLSPHAPPPTRRAAARFIFQTSGVHHQVWLQFAHARTPRAHHASSPLTAVCLRVPLLLAPGRERVRKEVFKGTEVKGAHRSGSEGAALAVLSYAAATYALYMYDTSPLTGALLGELRRRQGLQLCLAGGGWRGVWMGAPLARRALWVCGSDPLWQQLLHSSQRESCVPAAHHCAGLACGKAVQVRKCTSRGAAWRRR